MGFRGAKTSIMAAKVTKELQDTLRQHPNVENVYFDSSGRHYFYVHTIQSEAGEGKSAKKQYGRGRLSHRQVIPGETNIDQLKEDVAYGDPTSEIIETISREDVLNTEIEEKKESLVSQIANMSAEDRAALAALLAPPPAPASTPESKETEKPAAPPKAK